VDDSSRLRWSVGQLGDAVEALARASGLPIGNDQPSRGRVVSFRLGKATRAASTDQAPGESDLERLSRSFAFEAEATDVAYADIERTLQNAGPALLKVAGRGEDTFIALIKSSGRTVQLLSPSGRREHVAVASVASWLRRWVEEPLDDQVDRLLLDAGIREKRRPAGRRALFASRLGALTVTRCWMLRPAPSASLWEHLRHARLSRRLAVFLIAYVGAAFASLMSWWLIGGAALEGRFDPGTLLAWSFFLLSLVPLGVFAMWSQGVFILGVGGTLKLQLLAGALKLDPDQTRHEGVGQHLARVIESEAVETLALTGGFYAVAAFVDVALAAAILLLTSRGIQVVLLLISTIVVVTVFTIYFRHRERWTDARLALTHDLVEKMVGHRTQLVQGSAERAREEEDEGLERYVELSKRMDRSTVILSAMPRMWLLVGLIGLAPQIIDSSTSPTMLAIGLGATLLAFTALGKAVTSLTTLADAVIGWNQVAPLLAALRVPDARGHVDAVTQSMNRASSPPTNIGSTTGTSGKSARRSALIAGQDLAFRFRDRPDPVLSRCSFRIESGDRIHLSGASGSGKSTLVSLLTGLRVPESGVLLLDGLDRATLGIQGWRRRVAAAPQFHENYLFNDTLAFNLLMARRWPPSAEDLRWAEATCRRLGLGPLLDRMPGGLFQLVGETGWRLSHGERSRVFMARALLQGADLVVLDESFAELDPDNLRRCLPEAASLARSLLVVAHA
jgi:ATP-binding cassette subfamily B protein